MSVTRHTSPCTACSGCGRSPDDHRRQAVWGIRCILGTAASVRGGQHAPVATAGAPGSDAAAGTRAPTADGQRSSDTRAARMKEEFFVAATLDLRTPLTSIKGTAGSEARMVACAGGSLFRQI